MPQIAQSRSRGENLPWETTGCELWPSVTPFVTGDYSSHNHCLSSIILSPLNGNVKMSPYETGDIHVESEGTAASERDQRMHQGRHGVCQSRRTPGSERAPGETLEETYARRRGGGSGTRQPRPAQPPSPARRRA